MYPQTNFAQQQQYYPQANTGMQMNNFSANGKRGMDDEDNDPYYKFTRPLEETHGFNNLSGDSTQEQHVAYTQFSQTLNCGGQVSIFFFF
jgi:hypothetical protein